MTTDQTTTATAVTEPPKDDVVDAELLDEGAYADEKRRTSQLKAKTRTAVTGWWGYIAQPMSVKESWQRSGVIDVRRIPAESDSRIFALLYWTWWFMNRFERPVLFLLLGVLPTWANGPLLWCALRPMRRAGLYVMVILLTSTIPAIAAGS